MTYWADVSEWQTPVADTYPHDLIAIRSNDGTYRDRQFTGNYAWCRRQADAGKLVAFIVYCVYRPNWQQTLDTLKSQVGTPHPKMIVMVDVESWGGQISGDQSTGLNALITGVGTWLGDRRRVVGYGNTGDLARLWPSKVDGIGGLIVAGYSQTRPSYPGMVGWQYTDGSGLGPRGWPQGAAPWPTCDMNQTDLSTTEFAARCGITTGGTTMALTPEQDIKAQLTGSTEPGKYPGWPQLGGRTVVDALAAIGAKLGVDGFTDPKAKK